MKGIILAGVMVYHITKHEANAYVRSRYEYYTGIWCL